MNPTEIADALEKIATRQDDGGEFPFAFAAAKPFSSFKNAGCMSTGTTANAS
ncbi:MULTISPECIES: hypothetical protein [Roseobacteraceae]|jgi:hypothetical protein|uniref:hypothetical protein n=1 Tax=Roseobacteraceae TaxID=2854170 RepID=UPI00356AF236